MIQYSISIDHLMTTCPHGIDPQEPLALARNRMRDLRIRHLPVRSGGKVVGIISERDLFVLQTFPDIDFKKTRVGAVMTPDPYTVAPDTPADQVAAEMHERHIGSALVVNSEGHLLGIFTDNDALRVLASALRGDAALKPHHVSKVAWAGGTENTR